MTDRELAAAARQALATIESERELPGNPLLRDTALPYESLRSAVLSALESLEPDGPGGAAHKPWRLHAILVRCDLGHELHKRVMDSMALSRRQFYRERREALLALAAAIRRTLERTATATLLVDLGDAAEAYIEALRAAGQSRLVHSEASALAVRAAGEPREIEFWLVASEAARFLSDSGAASHALEQARGPANDQSYWRTLWIASSEMSLQWVAGDCAGARATFERAVRAAPEERTLHGKEAILAGIMLTYAASIELDCGRWEHARSLLARASRLAQSDGTAARRQSASRLSGVILRLSALLALHAGGDRGRSIADQRTALEGARGSGQLGSAAISAVLYGAALGDDGAAQGLPYAEYGLEIARRFYPGDRLAEVTLEALPLLLHGRGVAAGRRAVTEARCCGLGLRDRLFLDLADATIAAYDGGLHVAVERAEDVAAQLFRCGIDAWACEAQLLAIESSAKLGLRQRARRRLAEMTDALGSARAGARARARRLGTLLARPA